MVCAPVHDALLIEAAIDDIEQHTARLSEIMADASELVLGTGKRCRTDAKIIRYPDRFEDEQRGAVMFATIMKLLQEAEAAQ